MAKIDDFLFLTAAGASKYLACSRDELIAWVLPDLCRPYDSGPHSGERRWSKSTLDAAKPLIAARRVEAARRAAEMGAKYAAATAAAKTRRKGMRKAKALTSSKVCAALGCTLTELNRWAADGRLPPDGEIVVRLAKTVNARAWLPNTIETAKTELEEWRNRDATAKKFKRRGLRAVR